MNTDARMIYTLICSRTREDQQIVVCQHCAQTMPAIDGDLVTADPADDETECEFCTNFSDENY